MNTATTDVRESAILTPRAVARLVEMPVSTVYSWMRGAGGRDPVVHTADQEVRGWPSVPLFGLAEAHTARSLRRMHWPMRDVSGYAQYLREQSGDRFAFASPRLVTDGIDAYEDLNGELTRLRDAQIPISAVIAPFLRELVPWNDGRTGGYRPPKLNTDLVEIDPRFNTGRMSFVRTRVPLFAPLGALLGGDSWAEVAEDYRLNDVEVDIIERHRDWLAQAA